MDGLLREATVRLAEVDAAVARVAEDRYGLCENCGQRIASGRLEARPTARLCVTCAALSAPRPR